MADAHEIWAAAQLAPGEGIEDGVARIDALLALPAPAGEPEMPEPAGYTHHEDIFGNELGPPTPIFHEAQLSAYGDARAEHARRVAMEEAAKDADRYRAVKIRHASKLVRLATGETGYSSATAPGIIDAWADAAFLEVKEWTEMTPGQKDAWWESETKAAAIRAAAPPQEELR